VWGNWNKSGIIENDDQIDDCYRLASRVVMKTRQDRKSEQGRENDGIEREEKSTLAANRCLNRSTGDNYLSERLALRS